MRSVVLTLIFAAATSALMGCTAVEKSPPISQPTPPEVAQQFSALLETLDENRPGASAASLGSFLQQNIGYEIADTVEVEMTYYRSLTEGRYHEARELARQGRFDHAERMLMDLALDPESPDGESAQKHLEFDFYFGQAQWLWLRQRFSESAAVANSLLERDLSSHQMDQVETMLDNVGHVDAALAHAGRANAEAACRHLIVLLAQEYIEQNQYPARLSLAEVDKWDKYMARSIRRGLDSIQDYRVVNDNYSFIAVSSGGHHRIRVVDGEIQD
jgi:hypothetical protein